VQAVPVDDLAIGCAPRPYLEVIDDPAALGEPGEPVLQGRGVYGAEQGQHQPLASERGLVAGRVAQRVIDRLQTVNVDERENESSIRAARPVKLPLEIDQAALTSKRPGQAVNASLRAVAGSADQIQIMYGIGGERRLSEWEADWLSGYEKSVPVRIGNAAHTQLQLDVFGEIMDTYYQARRGGLAANEFGWDVQLMFLEHLTKIWRTPDQGIWEIRGPPQQFTYSKVMVWVAYDRAIKSVETFGLEGPLDDWRKLRDVIFEEVCECGFNQKLGTFVQAYGSDQLDANLLQLPCVGFLPADDPRIERTVAAIEQHLMRDGFVMRYSTDDVEDALPPGEGAFLACSFWLVDVYILQGRFDEAETLFRRLVGLCNDVGLLSEEYDPKLKRLVGNFPQAFSHLALVNSAYNLTRARKPVHQRAHDEHAPSEAVSEPAE